MVRTPVLYAAVIDFELIFSSSILIGYCKMCLFSAPQKYPNVRKFEDFLITTSVAHNCSNFQILAPIRL